MVRPGLTFVVLFYLFLLPCLLFAKEFKMYSEEEFVRIRSLERCIDKTEFGKDKAEKEEILRSRLMADGIDFSRDRYNRHKEEARKVMDDEQGKMLALIVMAKSEACIDEARKSKKENDYKPHYTDEEFILIAANLLCQGDAGSEKEAEENLKKILKGADIDFDNEKVKADQKYRRFYTDFYEKNRVKMLAEMKKCAGDDSTASSNNPLPDDDSLSRKQVGNWLCEEPYGKSEYTFNEDGTWQEEAIYYFPKGNKSVSLSGEWKIEDGYIYQRMTKSSMPDNVKPYDWIKLKIVNINDKESVTVLPEGERHRHVRLVK